MLTVPRFGDVIKVKILFRKRDSAMVEFRNAEQVTRLPQDPSTALFLTPACLLPDFLGLKSFGTKNKSFGTKF